MMKILEKQEYLDIKQFSMMMLKELNLVIMVGKVVTFPTQDTFQHNMMKQVI